MGRGAGGLAWDGGRMDGLRMWGGAGQGDDGGRAWLGREGSFGLRRFFRRCQGDREGGDVALDMALGAGMGAANGVAGGEARDVPEERIQHGKQNPTNRLRDGGRGVLWGGGGG